jgi:hypothetical protein
VRRGIIVALVVLAILPAVRESRCEIDPATLDQTIDEVLAQPEYAWRLGHQRAEEEAPPWLIGFLSGLTETVIRAVATVLDWIGRFDGWLRRLLGPRRGPIEMGSPEAGIGVPWLVLGLALVVVCVLLVTQLRRRTREQIAARGLEVIELSAVAEEESAADHVSEERWRSFALELAAQGRAREAVRAVHLAALSLLARAGLLRLARFKSNRDYSLELGRRWRTSDAVAGCFAENVSVYERVWYGHDSATGELLRNLLDNLDRIGRNVATS